MEFSVNYLGYAIRQFRKLHELPENPKEDRNLIDRFLSGEFEQSTYSFSMYIREHFAKEQE